MARSYAENVILLLDLQLFESFHNIYGMLFGYFVYQLFFIFHFWHFSPQSFALEKAN